MKIILITIFLLTSVSVYAQTDEKETLKQLTQRVISSYKSGKFDDAQKFAQQALDLNIKIYGNDKIETATAYANLGVILRERKKYKESVVNLQKAIDIYQKKPESQTVNLAELFESLALSQMLDGRIPEAEANQLKAFEIVETKFGKDSKESFSPTLKLANFYARERKYEKANEFYLKSYALAIKRFSRNSKEIEQIQDARACLMAPAFDDEAKKRTKDFAAALKELFGADKDEEFVNGKAIRLEKPAYPAEARAQKIEGQVSVRVKIDENGNVTEAQAICGNDILAKASEEAAMKSKFTPTMKDGKPVNIKGIVFYKFAAR